MRRTPVRKVRVDAELAGDHLLDLRRHVAAHADDRRLEVSGRRVGFLAGEIAAPVGARPTETSTRSKLSATGAPSPSKDTFIPSDVASMRVTLVPRKMFS